MRLKALRLMAVMIAMTLLQPSVMMAHAVIPGIDKEGLDYANKQMIAIETKNQRTESSQTAQSIDKQSQTRINQESITEEKAAFWGLTREEWQQYEKIKDIGGRGYWSPNLDPLTTLGVEAKTQEERERYAQLLAKKEFERTTKELAFQRVYDQMFKRLYPDVLPVELDDNPNFVAPLNLAGERMVLFLDVTDSVRGGNLLQKALHTGKEMDIYLLGTDNDDAMIQQWASFQRIPIEKVQSGLITLNHDRGQWAQIGKGITPVLLQEQQSGKWRQIELGD